MIRLGATRSLGLAVAVAGLLGMVGTGAAVAYEGRSGTWLRVEADGVAFDGRRVSHDARLEYVFRPIDGNHGAYAGHRLSGGERSSGWAAFGEAAGRYPDGYCISWLRLDNSEWGEWMDGPVCWEPAPDGGAETESEDEPAEDAAPEPTQEPTDEKSSGSAAGKSSEAESAPKPTPSAAEPTPEPSTPSPSPSPSPSASPSVQPSPRLSSNRSDPANSIVKSFGNPSPAADDSSGIPQAAQLTWLWVLLSGFGAAAGGALLMMRRAM
ncbi:hypothetical protein GCM10028784_12160 [Myceligenerans cantabricum]